MPRASQREGLLRKVHAVEEVLELRVGAIYLSVLARGGDAAANGAALSGRINRGGIVAGNGKCYGVHRGFSMTSEKKSNSHCMAYR